MYFFSSDNRDFLTRHITALLVHIFIRNKIQEIFTDADVVDQLDAYGLGVDLNARDMCPEWEGEVRWIERNLLLEVWLHTVGKVVRNECWEP